MLKGSLEGYVVRLVSLHRNQVKVEYLMSMESSESLIEEIGAQALNTAAYQLPDTVLQAIDAVTQDDVVKVRAFAVYITLKSEHYDRPVCHRHLLTLVRYLVIVNSRHVASICCFYLSITQAVLNITNLWKYWKCSLCFKQ